MSYGSSSVIIFYAASRMSASDVIFFREDAFPPEIANSCAMNEQFM
jgi:hypothetical protein